MPLIRKPGSCCGYTQVIILSGTDRGIRGLGGYYGTGIHCQGSSIRCGAAAKARGDTTVLVSVLCRSGTSNCIGTGGSPADRIPGRSSVSADLPLIAGSSCSSDAESCIAARTYGLVSGLNRYSRTGTGCDGINYNGSLCRGAGGGPLYRYIICTGCKCIGIV